MDSFIGQDIKRRVSYKKKIAKDYQRQKDIIDLYDSYFGDYRDFEELDKYNINYDLLNGRLDVSLYDQPLCIKIQNEKGKLEEITLDAATITHYPLISQVASAILGEQILRPFRPLAKDTGEFSQTLRNKKFNELLREVIQHNILNPITDEIRAAFVNQMNTVDTFQLTEEQLQEIENQINAKTKEKTPEEVLDFMVNDFRTPTQRQAQQLLDYFTDKLKFKALQEDGFKHALATGREVYYIGDRHDEPFLKLCNPKYVRWGGSRDTEWIQDAAWATYEEWLSIEEAQQEYAEYLSEFTNKELEGFIEPIGGLRSLGDPKKDMVQRTTMIDLSTEGSALSEKYKDINYKTKKGQNSILNLYADVINKYGKEYGKNPFNYGVRVLHVFWRDKRNMKRVTRLVDGQEKKFWFDEHYEERPEDIKVIDIWVDEIWEGTKLGAAEACLYINIRPIPNQYPSKYNPFGTKLPLIGKNYNTHMNNSKNVAWIDLGKTWQKDFDTTMSELKHLLKTDMGTQFLMFLELKPEGWKWQDWLNTAKNTGFMFSTLKKHGGVVDPNLLKKIDVGKIQDIAAKIQLLDYFRANLIQSLNFNDARIGAIGQYSTNQNVQQSQIASYNQTEAYFETHRQIFETALNAFMNRAKVLYKTNNKRFNILDDVARTELEISPDFWYEESAIEFSTSAEEIKKVENLKMQMQAFIQNGMSFNGILELALANNTSDIIDIMKKENKRMDQLRQEQMQIQQQQFQAQLQADMQDKQAQRDTTIQLELAKLKSQENRATMDMDKFRRQADADLDGRSDALEKSEMELSIKKLIEDKKAELAALKIQTDKELKEKELSIKLKSEENKVQIAKAKPKPKAK